MKIKKFVTYIGLLCAIFLGILLTSEPLYTPTALSVSPLLTHFPKYIAHKGIVSGEFHGNTLQAIQEALASYVDGIEVDVRFSKDNVPFLYHSKYLEDETDGHGKPENHTWEELQKLTYKESPEEKIVSLEDIFALVGSQKFIFLDIKTHKIFNTAIIEELKRLIYACNLENTVYVESFNPFFLISIRLMARDVLLMYDFATNATAIGEEVQSQFDGIPWLLKQPFFQKQVRRIVRPDVLGPRFNTDRVLLKSLIDHGYPLIAWTVDDPKVTQELFDMGIKGVQTNKPLTLIQETQSLSQVVFDAGGSTSHTDKVIHVKRIQDIIDAIKEARSKNKKITLAGRRHSMGGQTILNGAIQLDILGLNHVVYNKEAQSVTVGAGATWKKIQQILDAHGRSVKVMQSDNIFTVAGSVSVNVHGWQVGCPPIGSTILSMTVVLPDGTVRHISPDKELELFNLIVGGYGLFGVITEVELETVPNISVTFHAAFMKPTAFIHSFQKNVTNNPKVELAYGRLSVDQDHLFDEIGLFWYEKTSSTKDESTHTQGIKPESFVALKRGIFRISQYFELGKKLRWSAEKFYAEKMSKEGAISRNNAMNTDIHILWPLYGKNKDILHEYFVPKKHLAPFIDALKKRILDFGINVLNVTIREVRRDATSLMAYAKDDVFALVCLFSQKQTPEDEEKMRTFTQKVIDDALKMNGSFYLPYRLHFTKEQLLKAYPSTLDWMVLKKKWDPDQIFDSQFFEYIEELLKEKEG